MIGFTALTIAGVLGTLTLPGLYQASPLALATAAAPVQQSRGASPRATAPPPRADETLTYTVTLEQSSKGYDGKMKKSPTSHLDTVVSGQNARAEIMSAGKDFKVGDVLLTNDGGDTIHWIRGKSYVLMDEAYRQQITQTVASKMKVSIANPRVSQSSRGADDAISGFATTHNRISRSFDLGVRVLLMSVKVQYEDDLDVWTAKDLAGTPALEATFFKTFINMLPFADAQLRADTESAFAALPDGLPLKWSHASVTRRDDGQTEEGATTLVLSDVKRGGGATASFELPEGLRRVEKF